MIMEIKTYKSIKVVVDDGVDCFEYRVDEDDEFGSIYLTYSDALENPINFSLGDKESAKAVAKAILKICA